MFLTKMVIDKIEWKSNTQAQRARTSLFNYLKGQYSFVNGPEYVFTFTAWNVKLKLAALSQFKTTCIPTNRPQNQLKSVPYMIKEEREGLTLGMLNAILE